MTDKKHQPSRWRSAWLYVFRVLLLSVAHDTSSSSPRRVARLRGIHPESARIARLASGGRYGFAQSVFQLRRQFGPRWGPLLAAADRGAFGPAQHRVVLFDRVLAIVILWRSASGTNADRVEEISSAKAQFRRPRVRRAPYRAAGLVAALFSKQLYVSSLSSYYIFYLIEQIPRLTQPRSSTCSYFLAANAEAPSSAGRSAAASAANTYLAVDIGPLPFTLRCPMPDLCERDADDLHRVDHLVGKSSIIVLAQELMRTVGMISGVFFGVPSASAAWSCGARQVADHMGMRFVYQLRLPAAIGLLAVFLPKMPKVVR